MSELKRYDFFEYPNPLSASCKGLRLLDERDNGRYLLAAEVEQVFKPFLEKIIGGKTLELQSNPIFTEAQQLLASLGGKG